MLTKNGRDATNNYEYCRCSNWKEGTSNQDGMDNRRYIVYDGRKAKDSNNPEDQKNYLFRFAINGEAKEAEVKYIEERCVEIKNYIFYYHRIYCIYSKLEYETADHAR